MVAVSKYLSFLFAFSFLVSCAKKPTISGTIEFSENSNYKRTVYLIQPQKLEEVAASFFGKVIDSAEVEENGRFQFKELPTILEPTLFEIAIQQHGNRTNQLQNDNPLTDNYMPIVLQKEESIEITTHAENFQQNFQFKNPSEENAALVRLKNVKVEAFQQFLQHQHWDIHEGSQLLEKEEAHLNYQKALFQFAESSDYLIPSLVALRWISPENDYERVPEFLFQQCEQWKPASHPWATQLCQKADKENLPVLEGTMFPNAQIPLNTGDTIAIYSQLGEKLTIIDLWASWCVPCRKENSAFLVPLWDAYHDKGFQIIAYGLETSKEAWENAIEKDGAYRWLHASDLQGDEAAFMKTLRLQTIPANFLLDEEGRVIAKNLHGADLQQFVTTYLQQ
ncbi:MAG: TlpA disulfide reductase family protein [Flavobacteriaceae bacterium]|nr:TlpA family protein disulfide reductase [Flavobacteriaceae bacterium]